MIYNPLSSWVCASNVYTYTGHVMSKKTSKLKRVIKNIMKEEKSEGKKNNK